MEEKRMGQRRIVLAALLIALAVALGRMLAVVPNVEIVTLTVFLGGALIGPLMGTVIGGSVGILHSIANPLGPAPAPVLVAQIIGYSVIGISGGFMAFALNYSRPRAAILFAFAGFLLTLFYDAITTVATALVMLGTERFSVGFWAVAAASVPYSAIHVASNTALFGIASLPVISACRAVAGESR